MDTFYQKKLAEDIKQNLDLSRTSSKIVKNNKRKLDSLTSQGTSISFIKSPKQNMSLPKSKLTQIQKRAGNKQLEEYYERQSKFEITDGRKKQISTITIQNQQSNLDQDSILEMTAVPPFIPYRQERNSSNGRLLDSDFN